MAYPCIVRHVKEWCMFVADAELDGKVYFMRDPDDPPWYHLQLRPAGEQLDLAGLAPLPDPGASDAVRNTVKKLGPNAELLRTRTGYQAVFAGNPAYCLDSGVYRSDASILRAADPAAPPPRFQVRCWPATQQWGLVWKFKQQRWSFFRGPTPIATLGTPPPGRRRPRITTMPSVPRVQRAYVASQVELWQQTRSESDRQPVIPDRPPTEVPLVAAQRLNSSLNFHGLLGMRNNENGDLTLAALMRSSMEAARMAAADPSLTPDLTKLVVTADIPLPPLGPKQPHQDLRVSPYYEAVCQLLQRRGLPVDSVPVPVSRSELPALPGRDFRPTPEALQVLEDAAR
jgi:hypothetical protein